MYPHSQYSPCVHCSVWQAECAESLSALRARRSLPLIIIYYEFLYYFSVSPASIHWALLCRLLHFLLSARFSPPSAFLCLTSFVHFARLQGSLNKHKMATRAWIRQQHDVCICSTCNIYTLHTLRHLPTHTHTPTYTHALSPYEKQTNWHADAENANKKCVRGKEKGPRDLFCWCCWVNVFKIVVKFIGYENLMICKVADKREAPPGDTSKQQKPKPAECERILGIYSNINICLFSSPFVWLGFRLCDCEIDENFVA